MKLDGKCTIVTGASRGIGRAVTLDLLNRGAAVSGWARTSPEIENPNFHFVKVDVGDIGQVNKAYDQTTLRWEGRGADVLINNAGLGFEASFEKLPVEDWQKMFRTNVDGVFYCTRKVIARMKEEGEGHIVNISSVAGNVGIPKMAAYCGTKYAVKGMSHALYKELRNYGIKVSCIYPGAVNTNFFDTTDSVTANETMLRPEDVSQTIMHVLESPPNYHHVDIEIRPLRPDIKS